MTLAIVLWALLVAGASFTAIARAALVRPRERSPERLARAIVVRPCAGWEPGLEERLAQAGGAARVVLAVGSSLDPAATSVHRAARALRAQHLEATVVHTFAAGPNHKADQLARALARIAPPPEAPIIVADSDLDLARVDLAALVAPLRDPRTGAAWAPPIEAGAIETDGDALAHAVLGGSLHAFPLLAGIDLGGVVGKLFAVRAGALEEAGGFGALRERLGEDVALARALRRAGSRVAVAPVFAPAMGSGRSVADVTARLGRWARVVRSERPWLLLSYPLLFAPLPCALLALVAGVVVRDGLVAGAAALVIASRLAVALRGGHGLRDAARADVALLAGFADAVVRRSFHWRGRALRIAPGGRLVEERSSDEREHALRDAREERRAPHVDEIEAGPGVDARELGGDGLALRDDAGACVARDGERLTEGDPQLGGLLSREHVAHADRQHARAGRMPRDVGGTGLQLEREERRSLAALGEDPHRTPRTIEERGRMPDGAGAVARVVEVHAERADEREERQAREVSGVHHRVRLDADRDLGEPQRDERVPPRGVVRDDEERAFGRGAARSLETADVNARERRLDPSSGVAREPAREEAGAARGDHDGRPS